HLESGEAAAELTEIVGQEPHGRQQLDTADGASMHVARKAQMTGGVELGRPDAVAGAGDPALGGAVAETGVFLRAVPAHHVGTECLAFTRRERGAARLRLKALLDRGALLSRGGVDEAVPKTKRRILHGEDAALDVESLARAQLRGEAP